jgi:hypothetical protein
LVQKSRSSSGLIPSNSDRNWWLTLIQGFFSPFNLKNLEFSFGCGFLQKSRNQFQSGFEIFLKKSRTWFWFQFQFQKSNPISILVFTNQN